MSTLQQRGISFFERIGINHFAPLLMGMLVMTGCAGEPATTPLDVEATVEAAVSATLAAETAATLGGTPEPTLEATSAPTAASARMATLPPAVAARPAPESKTETPVAPVATPIPTPGATLAPTATPAPASTPTATTTPISTVTPSPTPRPKLATVSTSGRHVETIITSLGQQVDVTVVYFDDSPGRFNDLGLAINEGERLIGLPFPSPEVIMRRVGQVEGGFCGNYGPSYAPRYPGDPYVIRIRSSEINIRVDEDCNETFASIAHEVAHAWFHGNDPADWIDEGLANAIEQQVVANHPQGGTIYPPITYCESYRNIRELERGNPSRTYDEAEPYSGFGCNYTLGDGIFGALREHHGEDAFNELIARFARMEENEAYREHTISDVRRVLGGDSAALGIINLWYDGEPQMRKYRHLDSVEWTFPPTVDGDYLRFAGTINDTGTVHGFALGDDPYCSQFVLYEGI